MKKAIILHGICDADEYYADEYPSSSNSHWIPWLQKQLLKKDIDCQTPDVLNSYKGNYDDWQRTISCHTMEADTIVVTHSAGSGVLLKYLSLHKEVKLDKLIMVAPFNDPFGKYGEFLKVDNDPALESRIKEIHVLYARNEEVLGIKETVDFVMKAYSSAKLHVFETHGHFCFGDMGTTAFPELLDIVLQ